MQQDNLIKDIKPKSRAWRLLRRYFLNKYIITVLLFLVWMTFFDSTSFLVINEINKEIARYEKQLEYYKDCLLYTSDAADE